MKPALCKKSLYVQTSWAPVCMAQAAGSLSRREPLPGTQMAITVPRGRQEYVGIRGPVHSTGPGKCRSGRGQGRFLAPLATPLLAQCRNPSVFPASVLSTSVPGAPGRAKRRAAREGSSAGKSPTHACLLLRPQGLLLHPPGPTLTPPARLGDRGGRQHLDGPHHHSQAPFPGSSMAGASGHLALYQRPSSLCIRHWCQPLLRGDPSDAGAHLGPTGFPTHPLPTPSTELPQISG